MANKKNKSYVPDYYASKCGQHETFAMIYASMMKSKKYHNLPLFDKYLYLCCRCQLTDKKARDTLYEHGKAYGIHYPDGCFVFPAKHQREYGLDDRSNVAKGLQRLEEAGFIKKYEENRYRWKVNVYRFSAGWREE